MNRLKKILVSGFLILVLPVYFISCNFPTKSIVALADLVITSILMEKENEPIYVDQPVNFFSKILNQIDTNADETKTAPDNKLLVTIYYESDNGNWKFVLSKYYPVDELNAGHEEVIKSEATFHEPGNYLLKFKVDSEEEIKERDESNNDKEKPEASLNKSIGTFSSYRVILRENAPLIKTVKKDLSQFASLE